jgi:hypothetical protein
MVGSSAGGSTRNGVKGLLVRGSVFGKHEKFYICQYFILHMCNIYSYVGREGKQFPIGHTVLQHDRLIIFYAYKETSLR